MTTLGTMKTRIADELARSDLTTQIEREIQTAIAHYERERFYFNESTFTVSFQDGRDTYSSGDVTTIANLTRIDNIRINRDSSSRYLLAPRTWEELQTISANPNVEGAPTDYAYRAQELRVYPIADASYAAQVAAVVRLTALSSDPDTNAWMTSAEELIRQRAKRMLYTNVIRDYEEAAQLVAIEAEALKALKREGMRRTNPRAPIKANW